MQENTENTVDYIVHSSDLSFMEDVIEASKTTPVVVDFWAPWCGPCKQLTPALEKIAMDNGGKVKLVMVNIDENQTVAGQLRVQSVPTVYAFVDGKPVDGFMGAQPESELRKFFGKLTGETDIVAEAETLVARAQDSLEAGDIGGAAQDFASALQMNPNSTSARAGLARISMDSGDIQSAKMLLSEVPDEIKNHKDIVSVQTALSLVDSEDNSDEPEQEEDGLSVLLAAVKAAPDDLDARLAIAKAMAGKGDNQGASEHLLFSIAKNRSYDGEAARKFLLTIFEAEGSASDVSIEGRKALAVILFS
ncbi:MAG: thioredoxin [Robiginitomaculum sp.]